MANKVILNGNLGKDAEINKDGTRAVLSLATSEYYNGENHTDWHRVYFFKGLVKSCKELKKGQRVYIEAKLKTQKHEEEGTGPKYVIQVIGTSLEF